MSVACGGVRPSQLYALIQKRDCSPFRVGHPYKTVVSAEKYWMIPRSLLKDSYLIRNNL